MVPSMQERDEDVNERWPLFGVRSCALSDFENFVLVTTILL
jgi:hypothetical protein